MSEEVLIQEILRRRDPHGYYVVPIKEEALPLVRQYLTRPGVVLVEYSDVLLFKTRSRSLAEKVATALARRGLLAGEEEL